jgi:hypothetical protein
MRKLIKKQLFFVPTLVLLIVMSLSANKSIWPTSNELTTENKMSCVQFQNLKGSNRITEFQKLCAILFNQNVVASNQVFCSTKFSSSDVEKILGKADAQLQNGESVYYLNTSKETCKAIIGVDKTVQTIYCTITDCD